MFNPYKFIETKKLGLVHSPNSIDNFIKNFLAHKVENSQMSAWLMAVFFNGGFTVVCAQFSFLNVGKLTSYL